MTIPADPEVLSMAEVENSGFLSDYLPPVSGAAASAEAGTGDEGPQPSSRMKGPTPWAMSEKVDIPDRL